MKIPFRTIGAFIILLTGIYFYTGMNFIPQEAGYGTSIVGILFIVFGKEVIRRFYVQLVDDPKLQEAIAGAVSETVLPLIEKLYNELDDNGKTTLDKMLGLKPDKNNDNIVTADERYEALDDLLFKITIYVLSDLQNG